MADCTGRLLFFPWLTGASSPLLILWFLGVEMQFYLIWPLLFYLYKKIFRLCLAEKSLFFLSDTGFSFLCSHDLSLSPRQRSIPCLLRDRYHGFTLFLVCFWSITSQLSCFVYTGQQENDSFCFLRDVWDHTAIVSAGKGQ